MNVRRNFQSMLVLCLALQLCPALRAQRGGPGGGPGGGMGGMGGGGMMGGRGGMRNNLVGRVPGPGLRTEPLITLPGRWWDDKKTVKTVGLRSEQQQRMDDIFDANKGNLMSLFDNLHSEQTRFVSMPREDLQDETKVFAAIDRVAQARADLDKAYFHLWLQIRKEMDSVQLTALDREIANGQ